MTKIGWLVGLPAAAGGTAAAFESKLAGGGLVMLR